MSDLIDRQAAIDALDAIASELHGRKRLDEEYIASWCAEVIEVLPSAEPRTNGRWVKISPANIYECSECGKYVMTDDISVYAFCHRCGADMREEVQYE